MAERKLHISNWKTAYYGATIAIAAVFVYSIVVMIYVVIRSSIIIFNIMPKGERSIIIFLNNFSVAYSVIIISILMAVVSSVIGAFAAIVLKQFMLYFNPKFNPRNAIWVSGIVVLVLLSLAYIMLYSLLRDYITFYYPEILLFWFLFPTIIFTAVCIVAGSKLNKILSSNVTLLNRSRGENIAS
jgi:hypothetical protein